MGLTNGAPPPFNDESRPIKPKGEARPRNRERRFRTSDRTLNTDPARIRLRILLCSPDGTPNQQIEALLERVRTSNHRRLLPRRSTRRGAALRRAKFEGKFPADSRADIARESKGESRDARAGNPVRTRAVERASIMVVCPAFPLPFVWPRVEALGSTRTLDLTPPLTVVDRPLPSPSAVEHTARVIEEAVAPSSTMVRVARPSPREAHLVFSAARTPDALAHTSKNTHPRSRRPTNRPRPSPARSASPSVPARRGRTSSG